MWLAIMIWMPVKYMYCNYGNLLKILWPLVRSVLIVCVVEFIPVIDIIEDIMLPVLLPLLVFGADLECMMRPRNAGVPPDA